MTWKIGSDSSGRIYQERHDGYREYQLDKVIARRIRKLYLGEGRHLKHSLRALAIAVTGFECQMTGSDLVRLAQWTLDEQWE